MLGKTQMDIYVGETKKIRTLRTRAATALLVFRLPYGATMEIRNFQFKPYFLGFTKISEVIQKTDLSIM